MHRRDFLIQAAAVAALGAGPILRLPKRTRMYGLIGRMKAVAGQREALISILLEGTGNMPGCLSYIIARDPADTEGIWITEVWESRASHQASLGLPSVQQAIARGRPLIAGFAERFETEPVGGYGLGA